MHFLTICFNEKSCNSKVPCNIQTMLHHIIQMHLLILCHGYGSNMIITIIKILNFTTSHINTYAVQCCCHYSKKEERRSIPEF